MRAKSFLLCLHFKLTRINLMAEIIYFIIDTLKRFGAVIGNFSKAIARTQKLGRLQNFQFCRLSLLPLHILRPDTILPTKVFGKKNYKKIFRTTIFFLHLSPPIAFTNQAHITHSADFE